jgi:hypothetical protein
MKGSFFESCLRGVVINVSLEILGDGALRPPADRGTGGGRECDGTLAMKSAYPRIFRTPRRPSPGDELFRRSTHGHREGSAPDGSRVHDDGDTTGLTDSSGQVKVRLDIIDARELN